MSPSRHSLSPSQAAAHLGVTAKALRLYEQRGLIAPGRTSAGWRVYDPADLARAADVVALRALGLSLAQIARVMEGDPSDLSIGLAAHEERLRHQAQQIATTLEQVRRLRADLLRGHAPNAVELGHALDGLPLSVGFELPWPWAGEWFELRAIRPITFITGPLGSGKTRLAKRLAERLPDAGFLGLERLTDSTLLARLAEDADLAERVERRMVWLEEDGAERTEALLALVTAIEAPTPSILVINMVEQDLSELTQEALIAHLRVRAPQQQALFLMTRSSAILDLDAVDVAETVIYCPANHSPPICVVPYPGGQGYEAAATCLAPPDVRARTAGVIAARPDAA